MKKICLIASSGGHYEEVKVLGQLQADFNVFVVTERLAYTQPGDADYFIKQVNRREKLFVINMLIVAWQSLRIFIKEKPDVIISTGALAVIPMFIIGKICRRQLIFVESFAKVNSATMTGKFLARFVNDFYVQWEPMLAVYPKAKYIGYLF
ncbi:MAG: polysaccharide biosynthesis protein [Lactobacillaceae bacterium]|jgi:UDP-N-acetylglucosamine:LPS N-acetylglucosamine transferase|nr:polysaccharide biosynthesis protein [Lactobacillaceae bacterium]